ncbi:MAG: HD domain-containing protein [Planctomycetota bacterium]|nr:MAG: HD domain-containing protein [Planctomycetota bacterium]
MVAWSTTFWIRPREANLEMIPELSDHVGGQIRIPGEVNVPVSPRVRAVLDTEAVQRLKKISQLGLVTHVYPGATHSRFEHSLGVYRLALLVIRQLIAVEPDWARRLDSDSLSVFLLSALLHDVGHWPFCHPIEDLGLDWVPRHEDLARRWLCEGELADVIRRQWGVDPARVADFLAPARRADSDVESVLRSVLNGPVDIDKMDYLQRDSLHAGVPYGQNFDLLRLVGALIIDQPRHCLAITEKGKTAAEMLVFGRYVMFSEVYWHHAVRSATAMLQRLVFHLGPYCHPHQWMEASDHDFITMLQQSAAAHQPALVDYAAGLFGTRRRLFKRVLQFNYAQQPELYRQLANASYATLEQLAGRLAQRLSRRTGQAWDPWQVLIDAPPSKLEVQFDLRVRDSAGSDALVHLAQVSPVVQALATEQFDQHVKRVRVYIAPDRARSMNQRSLDVLTELQAAWAEEHGDA